MPCGWPCYRENEPVVKALAIKLRLCLAGLLLASIGCLTLTPWYAGRIHAASVENLMVPSAAMGREIPVTFIAGGPHAVYLLDAFDAGPDVSNWVTAGNAMKTLAGRGISVAAPAGGAYSMYTNWEQDGSKQWETFLSAELPEWLAANKGLAPGGHAVVGAAQGGYGALALAAFILTGSASPVNVGVCLSIGNGFRRCDPRGPATLRRCGRQRDVGSPAVGPVEMARPLHSPRAAGPKRHAHMDLQSKDLDRRRPGLDVGRCRSGSGRQPNVLREVPIYRRPQRSLRFASSGDHGWSTWGPELGAMCGDIAGAIR